MAPERKADIIRGSGYCQARSDQTRTLSAEAINSSIAEISDNILIGKVLFG